MTQNLRDSIAESRKRKVDHCVFPGFRVGELTELPTQIEAPHILHRVTKAQDFNVNTACFDCVLQGVLIKEKKMCWIHIHVIIKYMHTLYSHVRYTYF